MRRNRLFTLFLLLTGLWFLLGFQLGREASLRITIDNTQPRRTTDRQIVDAHDGRVIQFGDRYYWYGTAYDNTNGFVPSNHYRCYSSPDLQTWTYEGRLLPDQPEGVYYRPHVIYNERTEKYVLWFNWYPQLWDGQFGVAVSDSPAGPFEILNDNVTMANSELGVGDFGLFVDADQTAYISYNTIQGHRVSIERLDADYTGSSGENGGFIASNVEAGSQFKREGKYYLLTDFTCCFCNFGSGARVYVSDDPLTGYELTGNINRYPGDPAPVLLDGQTRGTRYATLTKTPEGMQGIELALAQPAPVTEVTISLFTGNRPANCGDVSNPRVHPPIATPGFRFWVRNLAGWREVPATRAATHSSALSETIRYTLDATAREWRIVPDSTDYPFAAVYVNEVQLSTYGQAQRADAAYVFGPQVPRRPIIPAQQTYVMELATATGTEFIWMGDLWGSASDNSKGHDYQYWSAPLEFNADGTIRPMEWTDTWTFEKPNR